MSDGLLDADLDTDERERMQGLVKEYVASYGKRWPEETSFLGEAEYPALSAAATLLVRHKAKFGGA